MKKLPTNTKRQIGWYTSYRKAFTLIELLVVIAIIGILAGVVIASLNSARTSGRVASIKSNLKNLQTAATMYHNENGTFAGLCGSTYSPSSFTPHESIAPMIDAISSIAGSNNIRCIVRTASVPSTSASHNIPEDALPTKNFGVAVYFNERHYGVDTTGVITLDEADTTSPSATQNWATANNTCAALGKRLPSIEILKAINDYGAQGVSGTTNLGFLASLYWSSTPSSGSYAYSQRFANGNVDRVATTNNYYVRCAA